MGPAPTRRHHVGVVTGQRQRGLDPLGRNVGHTLFPVDQEVGQAPQLGFIDTLLV